MIIILIVLSQKKAHFFEKYDTEDVLDTSESVFSECVSISTVSQIEYNKLLQQAQYLYK